MATAQDSREDLELIANDLNEQRKRLFEERQMLELKKKLFSSRGPLPKSLKIAWVVVGVIAVLLTIFSFISGSESYPLLDGFMTPIMLSEVGALIVCYIATASHYTKS